MDLLPRPTKSYHRSTYERISSQHGFDGTGKTILITGGASGIGFHISRAFGRAGAKRVVLVSRSVEAQVKSKEELEKEFPNVEILTFQASVTDEQKFQKIFSELGGVDVLVLNAAIAHRRSLATELDVQDVRDAFEINVISTFLITKTYLTMAMPSVKSKTIINVSSAAAHMIIPHRVGYGASKAAAAQVLQSFASQFKGQDVKVVSFHPGSIYTPGVAKNIPKDMFPWDDEELPADFALWLAGPESNFLHGRHVWAHWDVDELIALKDRIETQTDLLTIGLVQ